MKKVLLVEDDPGITDLLMLHFIPPAYELTAVNDGKLGLELASEGIFDLVIVDWTLPGLDGLEICRRIREEKRPCAILMLTSRSEEIDKVLALELGADDYVTKPFSIRELVARSKALIRRSEFVPQPSAEAIRTISVKDLTVDQELRKATLKNERLDLTPKEFDLLFLLVSNPGKAFSRQELLEKVWGYTFNGYEHTVTSHVNRLRIKIETDLNDPRYILTAWGVGYRFMEC